LAVELKNILVSDLASGIYEGQVMSERLSLRYSNVRWLYT